MRTIEFQHKETLQTAHPKYEVTIEYTITAKVDGDEVTVEKILMCAILDFSETSYSEAPIPDESTTAGARFIGLLREKARQEYHRRYK